MLYIVFVFSKQEDQNQENLAIKNQGNVWVFSEELNRDGNSSPSGTWLNKHEEQC